MLNNFLGRFFKSLNNFRGDGQKRIFYIKKVYLIYSMFSTDLNSKETNIYKITSRSLRSHNDYFICLVLFSRIIRKNFDSQGRPRWYWYRWHWKFRIYLRIVLIHEECGNLKVFIDGGELLEILTKRRTLYHLKKCWMAIRYTYHNHTFFSINNPFLTLAPKIL